MRLTVREMIETMDEGELFKLKADLGKGAMHIKKLVSEKIKLIEERKAGYCITCGKDLVKHTSSYNLVFGPDDFRKKAAFCEIDCLEYFISELKKIRGGVQHELQKNNPAIQ